MRSYTPRSAVGLSFRRAAVVEPHARKRLDLVRGRSLTPRVSPSAEWHRPITGQPVTTVRTPHAFSCDTASAISHFLRSNSGSLAIFAAIRRASSRYGPCLCRMYAGRGHTTPSSCDQKMQFDRDQVFLTATDTAFWESSRRSKHEKAEANLDIERCSYLEEACKEKDAGGNNCRNFEEN